jgi:hypothetical protein
LNDRTQGDLHSMFRRVITALLGVGALFAVDAAVADAKVFRGETTQGRPASVVIGTDGLLRTARVNWRARCRHGRVVEKTSFLRPHDVSSPDAFRDGGVYRKRQRGGYRLRFTPVIRGERVTGPRGEHWRGTFRAKVLVTRRGHYVDTCRVARLRWTARLVR